MFFKYLGKELFQRKRQTALVSIALGTAIAMVVIVNAASAGINSAQSKVLSGLYGIGTDLTISQTSIPTPGGQRFDFDGNDPGSAPERPDFSTFSQDRVEVARFSGVFSSKSLSSIEELSGVSSASATLKLNSISFTGSVPTQSDSNGQSQNGVDGQNSMGDSQAITPNPGRGNFEIDSKSIEGVDVLGANVGPLNGIEVSEGRMLAANDAGTNVAILDATYALGSSLKAGDTITLKSTPFKVIGIVSSKLGSVETSSNIYIPLDVAQTMADKADLVTNFYVSAKTAAGIETLQSDLEKIFPDATVSSQSELASSLTGSLSSASSLVNTLGKWLSIIVLLVAFAFAGLFTSSGITRRVREFGTLKAIGWRNSRITRQIMGETFATSTIGAAFGLLLGILGISIVNLVAPSFSSAAGSVTPFGSGSPMEIPGGGLGGPGGGLGGFGLPGAQSTETIVHLHLGLSPSILLIAIGISLLGGIVAGSMGALRASKLTPASALRSVS